MNMNWTTVSVGLAFFLCIFGVANYISNNVGKEIDAKLNDPKFIKEVADKVRLPFLIFDSNKKYICDTGDGKYIESIQIVKEGRNVSVDLTKPPNQQEESEEVQEIIVTSKMFLVMPPILQNLGGQMQFYEPERIAERGWKYKAFPERVAVFGRLSKEPPPSLLFKLDIIPNN